MTAHVVYAIATYGTSDRRLRTLRPVRKYAAAMIAPRTDRTSPNAARLDSPRSPPEITTAPTSESAIPRSPRRDTDSPNARPISATQTGCVVTRTVLAATVV